MVVEKGRWRACPITEIVSDAVPDVRGQRGSSHSTDPTHGRDDRSAVMRANRLLFIWTSTFIQRSHQAQRFPAARRTIVPPGRKNLLAAVLAAWRVVDCFLSVRMRGQKAARPCKHGCPCRTPNLREWHEEYTRDTLMLLIRKQVAYVINT